MINYFRYNRIINPMIYKKKYIINKSLFTINIEK